MKYRRAIVSFVDILGFRSMVETRPPEFIAEILGHLIAATEPLLRVHRDEGYEFVNFSDNVVRILPLERRGTPHLIDRLFTEITGLALTQAKLSQRGVFLRGGVTIGQIAFGDGIVFGPAMNRAYELESRIARTPRIILDHIEGRSDRLRDVLTSRDFDEDDYPDLKDADFRMVDYLRRDADGWLFIDYIHGLGTEDDSELGDYELLKFLERHRRSILAGAESAPAVAADKYAWLRAYHDSSLRILRDPVLARFGRTREDFAVGD